MTSTSVNAETPSYAEWLQARMEEKELTQRQLAKLLRPDSPETARRAVRRYLKGMVPTERTRQHISVFSESRTLGPTIPRRMTDLVATLNARIDELHLLVQRLAVERRA